MTPPHVILAWEIIHANSNGAFRRSRDKKSANPEPRTLASIQPLLEMRDERMDIAMDQPTNPWMVAAIKRCDGRTDG